MPGSMWTCGSTGSLKKRIAPIIWTGFRWCVPSAAYVSDPTPYQVLRLALGGLVWLLQARYAMASASARRTAHGSNLRQRCELRLCHRLLWSNAVVAGVSVAPGVGVSSTQTHSMQPPSTQSGSPHCACAGGEHTGPGLQVGTGVG